MGHIQHNLQVPISVETTKTAVSDLFKNINNARALRKNELATRFFDRVGCGPEGDALGLRRVRSAISQALSAMEEPSGQVPSVHEKRQAAIIRRCEFEGVAHKEVASDLGIGIRHFYRELRFARATFVKRLQAVVVAEESHISDVVDLFELQLQRARALMNACNFEGATRSAEAVLRAVVDDERKLIVLTLFAETLAESRDLGALQSLERTVLEMPKERFPISRTAIIARLRTLQGRAEYLQGSLEKASAICGSRLFRDVQMLGDKRERALWASSLFEAAAFHALIGDYKNATPQILLGRDLVGETEKVSPMLRFRAQFGLADLNLATGSITEGKARLKQAYRIAVDHNLVSATFDASFMLAAADWMDGNRDAALRISREAVEALSNADTADEPWYLITAAKIEANCRNMDSEGTCRALNLLSQVRTTGAQDAMRMYMARAMEAECYTTQRRYAPAALGASTALRGFRKIGVLNGLGYALRVAAEVEAGMGNTSQAWEYITESLELLERHGHPRALHKALEVAGRLTRNAKYNRRARELA